MLFDLEKDPDESMNIYADAEDIHVELEDQLARWQRGYRASG